MKKAKVLKKSIACISSAAMIFTCQLFPVNAEYIDKENPNNYDNFANALQLALCFYDANKCGKRTGNLEWRGDCHMEDQHIPLKKYGEDFKGLNVSEEFISKNKAILDPDGDGYMDCEGGMHDAGDHVKFCLPGSYAASTLGWGYYEFRDSYVKTGNQEHMENILNIRRQLKRPEHA